MGIVDSEAPRPSGFGSDVIGLIREYDEITRVFGYLAVVVVTSVLLVPMVATAWQMQGLLPFIATLPAFVGLASLPQYTVFLLGLWFSLVALLWFDIKKRVQGVVLALGTAVAVASLCQLGLVCGRINLLGNLLWFLGGGVFGALLGGIRGVFDNRTPTSREFRRASKLLFVIGTLLVVGAFVEVHLMSGLYSVSPSEYDNVFSMPVNALLAAGYVVSLRSFLAYDAETKFFVLGPRGSGKTMFLLGAYREADEAQLYDDRKTPPNPTRDLTRLLQFVDEHRDEWPPATRPDEAPATHGFQYVHGRILPRNVTVNSIDYAGEDLSVIAELLAMGSRAAKRASRRQQRGGIDSAVGFGDPFDNETRERKAVLLELRKKVKTSDTLIFLFDVERFLDDQKLEVIDYFNILEEVGGASVILVATKCDLLVDDFRRETGGDPVMDYDDFKRYVNERLQTSEQVRALTRQAAGSEIYPVYFQTRVDESGNHIPMRDDHQRLLTVGFDELLDQMGRYA
jgi:GTPase SAR1 family protein